MGWYAVTDYAWATCMRELPRPARRPAIPILLGLALLALFLGGCAGGTKKEPSVMLVAAGDIACNPINPRFNSQNGTTTSCRQRATSDLIGALRPTAVMPLGDTQYQRGTYSGYLGSYAPTWGRFLSITHPVVGNHEYQSPNAQGYYRYFGAAAGDPNKGYYSFDVGTWHVVVLNSECKFVGGCSAGSAQERWLRSDLAAHPAHCTLAAWHEPRWSSGEHGTNPIFDAFWRDLYAAGADIVLNGHDHDYERFAPLDPSGRVDAQRGIREFVVGTGGDGLRPSRNIAFGSEVRANTTFGVLALTLGPAGFDWRFVPAKSGFTDSGHGDCH
jgi:hypothetical protein